MDKLKATLVAALAAALATAGIGDLTLDDPKEVPQAGSPRSQDVAGRRAWRDRRPHPQRLAGQTVKRLN